MGRTTSELLRGAVDALLLGINPEDLRQLDAASKRAEEDIAAMLKTLDANTRNHKAFMVEIAKLRAAA